MPVFDGTHLITVVYDSCEEKLLFSACAADSNGVSIGEGEWVEINDPELRGEAAITILHHILKDLI